MFSMIYYYKFQLLLPSKYFGLWIADCGLRIADLKEYGF
jgi:hypothetical protein